MLINRRNGLMAGGWKNPYVTDGLVAMWDGEWNAGPGKHDATSVGLANLAGSAQLTFPSNLSYMSMGDKSLDISLVHENTNGARLIIPANTFDLAFLSVEVCCSRGTDSTGEFGMTMQNGILFLAYATTAIRVRSYNNANGLVMNDAKTVTSTATPNTISFTYDGTTAKAYINNALLRSVTQTLRTFNYTGVSFGSLYLYNSGSIYDIRVYSRVLTAAEIAANYAIDKARFNLPDAT